jgi:hypothetical protein
MSGWAEENPDSTYDPRTPLNQTTLSDLTDAMHARDIWYFLVAHVDENDTHGRTRKFSNGPLSWGIGVLTIQNEARIRMNLGAVREELTPEEERAEPETPLGECSINQIAGEIVDRVTDCVLMIQDGLGAVETRFNDGRLTTFAGGSDQWIIGALTTVLRREVNNYLDPDYLPET